MAGVLELSLRSRLAAALAVLAVAAGTASAAQPASTQASTLYTTDMTGYAIGNLYGASGYIVGQGDFANHSQAYCSADPSAYWAWGTEIDLVSPSSVTTYDGDGNPTARGYLFRYDTGDPSCVMPRYWVDVYFGRWATWEEANSNPPCCCSGSPCPGYCYDRYHSNCQDARNFGRVYNAQYYGP